MYQFANPEDPTVRQFFADRLGVQAIYPGAKLLAFQDADGVLGGWVFERYTGPGGSVTMHWAGRDRGWLKLDMLVMCAVYVFEQLACKQAIGEVRASDTEVRRVDEKVGFKEIATIPGYFPDDDLVIYRMERAECRFLPANHVEGTSDGKA